MAINKRAPSRDRDFDCVVQFADQLGQSLENASNKIEPGEVRRFIEKTIALPGVPSAIMRSELDKLGTSLWNISIRRVTAQQLPAIELACSVRLFACMLIECAQRKAPDNVTNTLRAFRCIVKTFRLCLDKDHLELAGIAAERAAYFEERLNAKDNRDDTDVVVLIVDQLILRIGLAWRRKRFDVARMMWAKINDLGLALPSDVRERFAFTLFEIGQDQHTKAQFVEAIFWLEKSRETLERTGSETAGADPTELKRSVMYCMARALHETKTQDNGRKAWAIVNDLESDYGDRLPFNLLKLDLYASEPVPPISSYSTILDRMITTLDLTELNVKTILSRFHQLRKWDRSAAQTILLAFISKRLVDSKQQGSLEQALIIAVWNGTTAPRADKAIQDLKKMFDHVFSVTTRVCGPAAAFSIQALLWKAIEPCHQQENHHLEAAWCSLGLHKILADAEEANLAKLQRRLMRCALDNASLVTARQVYLEMVPKVQSEAASQFLLYKVALRSGDASLATDCLSRIYTAEEKDVAILFACILDAQEVGQQALTLAGLQRLLQEYDHIPPVNINQVALLRCTTRLLIQQIESQSPAAFGDINDLCNILEGSLSAKWNLDAVTRKAIWIVAELDWFSHNTYNLALKNLATWPEAYTIRLLDVCLHFIELYPSDIEPALAENIRLKESFCQYSIGSLHTSIARREDAIGSRSEHYLAVRKAVQAFRSLSGQIANSLGDEPRHDFRQKHLALLTYDFEAAACLESWDDLSAVIKECQEHENASVFPMLADIILGSRAPSEVMIKTLQQIINAVWVKKGSNLPKLSRWIRCLFTLSIPQSPDTAIEMAGKAVRLAEKNKDNLPNEKYPSNELEWLAATIFNYGIDLRKSGQENELQRWVQVALSLAKLASDGGRQHKEMQDGYRSLIESGERVSSAN